MIIQAIVRNGELILDSPLDLPDGTVLSIPVPTLDVELEDTPEEIDRWIRWYDAFEPVQFSDAERTAWEKDCTETKACELGDWSNNP